MPTVPSYNSQQVRQSAIPDVRFNTDAPIEAFGGGASAQKAFSAAEGLAGQAFKLAEEEKAKADDTATKEAYAKLVKAKNDLMYNKDTGAMTRKGKDAFGVIDEYEPEFDKKAEEIEAELNNDSQREMFRQIKSKEKLELSENLQKHTFSESQKFEEEVTESGLSAAREDGLLNYHNPGKLAESINTQKSLIIDYAAKNGKPDEWVQNKMLDASSKTNAGVIGRLLSNGDDLTAKKFFDENKESFTGSDIMKVEKDLQEGSLRGETQRQSTLIMDQSRGDLRRALDQARQIEDPKIQESVVSEIKVRHAENERITAEQDEKRFQSTFNYVEKNLQLPDPGQWNQLKPNEKVAVESWLNKKRKGEEPDPNSEDYYQLMHMAAGVDPQGFKTTNLMLYKGKITDGELASMIKMQTDLKGGTSNSQLDGFRTDQGIVNDTLTEAGFDTSPKPGTDDAKKVNAFRRQVDDQIRATQERTGKKATNVEVQGIVDSLMVKGRVENSGIDTLFFGKVFQKERRIFELGLDDAESISVSIKDIPIGERRKIEQALRNNGKTINDAAIVEYFGKKAMQKGGG